MVQKSNNRGYLFDDTPRGLMEMLLIGGGIIATLSVAPTLLPVLGAVGYVFKASDAKTRNNIHSSFQYLVRHNYVEKTIIGKTMRIRLTNRGRARILSHIERRALLKPIPRPSVWDRRWRIILFDIPAHERTKRNAFRSMLRRIGAVMLQKSVWVYPFDCQKHIELLRTMFNFSNDELRLVVADAIGNDKKFRQHFRL